MLFINLNNFLPCLYGLEKKQDMTSSLAESYWPSCVSIGRVALYRPSLGSYDLDRFCHIHTVLLMVNYYKPYNTSMSDDWSQVLIVQT